MRNPSTNVKPKYKSKVKVVLREESGLDVGYGQIDLDLPLMHPGKISVFMEPYSQDQDCQRLGAVCHLMI